MSFFGAEQLLVERLTAKLAAAATPPPARVFTAADLAQIEERQQIVPAVYVVFESYRPVAENIEGKNQRIEEYWTVTVAVRNAAGQGSAAGVRTAAEPLLAIVSGALCGWKPAANFSALTLQDGPGPLFTPGFAYFPLRFRLRTHLRGDAT